MAIGGETIGRAYIRILADGTGFDDDLRRQMRQNQNVYSELGKEANAEFHDGWNEETLRQGGGLNALRDALHLGEGRMYATGQFLATNIMSGLRDELVARHGEVGTVIAKNLTDDFNEGSINFDGMMARLSNIRVEIARATKQITDEQGRQWDQLGASVQRYHDGLNRGGPSRLRLLRDIRLMVRRLPEATTNLDSFRNVVTKMRRDLVSTAPRLQRYREELANTGTLLGRVFGKGSRNDFLNFVGSFMQGINTLIRGLASFYKWPGLIAEQMGLLIAKFVALRDEQGTFGAIFSLIKGGAGGLVSILVGVVAAVTTVSTILPAFGAAIVGVTGMVLALAGSLGFALVGGAAAALGALFPLAAGLGVVALAIGGLDKENKAVKQNLKQLEDQFKRLQTIAAQGMFGKDGAGLDNLTVLMKAIEPIVKSVSKALGGLLDDLGDVAKTKEFRDLMKELSEILPPMVTTLGRIGGNIGLGLIRAFIVLEPYITDFLGWMEDVSTAFADAGKATDTKGLTGMAAFFDKAAGSAMRLWDLITSVGAVIATVFSAGKSTGDNIITSLADQAQDLNKWLTSPEGRQALKDMFAFAEQLAEALGRVVIAAIEFIDALDTPRSRQMLLDIVGVIETIIGWLTVAAGWMNTWIGLTQQMAGFWRGVGSAVLEAATEAIAGFASIRDYVVNVLWPDIQDAWMAMSLGDLTVRFLLLFEDLVRGIKMLMTGFFQWWADNVGKLPLPMQVAVNLLLGPWIWLYDALIGNSIIPDLINGIVDWFGRLPGMIFTALGDLAGIFVTWVSGVPGAIAWVVGGIAGVFGGLSTKIIKAAGDVNKAFSDWFRPVAGIAGRTNDAIIRAFAGLAGKIIKSAGSFSKALGDWLAPGPPAADRTSDSIARQFVGMASASIRAAGSLANAVSDWGNAAVREAHSVANGIVNQFRGLSSDIENVIGTVHVKVVIDMPNIPRPHVTAIVDMPESARGGVFSGAQARIIGEAGPEAIVPLNRPLSQVDPAVRALSAFAQGLSLKPTKKEPPGGTENNVSITVITPVEDPRAVATEVFSRLVAASYI